MFVCLVVLAKSLARRPHLIKINLLLTSCCAGTALYDKDAERSMRDIESTLLVCAQQCALDDEDEVRMGLGCNLLSLGEV